MRIICPNCGAQYEVDDAVIPETGRDVQCSNCGHTWFQRPAHLDRELAEELGEVLPEEETTPESKAEPPHPRRPAVEEKPAPRRRLDPAVAELLREEAEREARARRGETVESQPDLGIEAPPRRAPAVEEVVRKAAEAQPAEAGREEEEGQEERRAGRARRHALPEVEEISSTLRPAAAPERAEEQAPAATTPEPGPTRRRRGFRIGFALAVLAISLAAIVYLLAPEIGRALPGAKPWLQSYAAWVEALRAKSDALYSAGVERIQSLIERFTGGGAQAS